MRFNPGGRPPVVFPLAALCLASSLLLAACGKTREAGEAVPSPQSNPPATQSFLIGSEQTPDLASLQDTVEARALRGDTLGLLRLMVNDSVYRTVVWPTTPSYEPEREEVWNLVMSMHKANSNKGLRRLMYDILQPEDGPALRPALGATEIPGGTLHALPKTTRTSGGVMLFGSALCLTKATGQECQVLSYSQGGARGGSREDAADAEYGLEQSIP
jgi:hypothetical protein